MSGVSPYELLTFASSSVAAALGALLLGLRIPGGQALGTLRTARGYLTVRQTYAYYDEEQEARSRPVGICAHPRHP